MESKQFFYSLLTVLLITVLLTLTSWYININKPNIFKYHKNIKNVTNDISDKLKERVLGNNNINKYDYFITEIKTYSKNKSLIPGVYKDSIFIKKRTIYTCE